MLGTDHDRHYRGLDRTAHAAEHHMGTNGGPSRFLCAAHPVGRLGKFFGHIV